MSEQLARLPQGLDLRVRGWVVVGLSEVKAPPNDPLFMGDRVAMHDN